MMNSTSTDDLLSDFFCSNELEPSTFDEGFIQSAPVAEEQNTDIAEQSFFDEGNVIPYATFPMMNPMFTSMGAFMMNPMFASMGMGFVPTDMTTATNGLSPLESNESSTLSIPSPSSSSSVNDSEKSSEPAKKKKKTNRKTATSTSGSDSESKKAAKKRKPEEIDHDDQRLQDLSKKQAEQLTEQEKEEKKKLRNRHTAKQSRDRKKQELNELRNANIALLQENETLKQQNMLLQGEVARLNLFISTSFGYSAVDVPSTYSVPSNTTTTTATRTTAARSIILVIGIVFVLGLLSFMTGGYNYNSFSSTITKQSIPTQQPVKPRGLGRTLLSHNRSESYTTERRTPPPQQAIPTQKSSPPASNSFNPESVYVESTMEMGENSDIEFSGEGMISYDVIFPTKLKRHFSTFQQQERVRNEISHLRNYENSTSNQDNTEDKSSYNSLTSTKHNNSKQLMSLTSPTFLSKRMEEKGHKYEKAKVYVPMDLPDSKRNELHLFCPYLYPLMSTSKEAHQFSTHDFDTSKKSVKIHIPVQMVCNKSNTKVIRMAEINAENFKLSEAFYEFNSATIDDQFKDAVVVNQQQ